jgi:hypothetical protein
MDVVVVVVVVVVVIVGDVPGAWWCNNHFRIIRPRVAPLQNNLISI